VQRLFQGPLASTNVKANSDEHIGRIRDVVLAKDSPQVDLAEEPLPATEADDDPGTGPEEQDSRWNRCLTD
jgi:hypothetical protein